jgi:hypothetical protein
MEDEKVQEASIVPPAPYLVVKTQYLYVND